MVLKMMKRRMSPRKAPKNTPMLLMKQLENGRERLRERK